MKWRAGLPWPARQSSATHVHLDLSVIQAEEEDAFEVEAWAWEYWGPLLDGLATPVSKLRTGLAARLMGAGVPNGWEGLCRWSVGNEPFGSFLSPDLHPVIWQAPSLPI